MAKQFPHIERFHWVMDNLNTHWSLELCRIIAWLSGFHFDPQSLRTGSQRRAFLTDAEHRHQIHYTPKHGSWLSQIEIWFGALQRRLLRHGEFRFQAELARQLRASLAYYNTHWAKPYRWTYTSQRLVP